VRRYFRDLFQIILHPARFFRRMPLEGGVSSPLAFALITHWLGTAVAFLWRAAFGGTLGRHLNALFDVAGDVAEVDHPGRAAAMMEVRDRILHWFWGAGSVIADPFLTLASILFTSLLVFVGARILVTPGKGGAPSPISYESALRLVCYGMSPAILAVIPLAGPAIAGLWTAVVTIVGAREIYRISTGRALVVALFPKLLFLGIMMTGFFLLAVVFLKVVASAFSGF
jgi:hypothetical protein